ncbi:hypothetical protein JYT83_00865 [bacterium AH-315-F18]|nr:hypothetical protein [bacterium AH-315-F18]
MQYANAQGVFPGGGSESGLGGFHDLVSTGCLTQIRSLICPSSVDILESYGGILRGGVVRMGFEREVIEAMHFGEPIGSVSYIFTSKLISGDQNGGLLLCVDASHNVSEVESQLVGKAHDGHADGLHSLTNDGAVEFIRVRTNADVKDVSGKIRR